MPNLYPNLSSAATPNPQPSTNFNQMKEQFEQLKKQKETVDARQRQLKAQRAKECNVPPVQAIPDLNNNNNNNDNNNSIDSVEAWAEGLEAEEAAASNTMVAIRTTQPIAALDQVAQAVEKQKTARTGRRRRH